ncbi:T9SS type A sorting domain-containing protein [soil metagenome]
MKPIYSLLALCMLCSNLSAQDWLRNVPKAADAYKEDRPANFKEIQQAFHEYWKGKEINAEDEGENAEEGGYQQFARWEYLMHTRTAPDGNFFDQDILCKEYYRLKGNDHANEKALSLPQWNYIGQNQVPTNGGGTGRLNVVRIDPNNTNIMYVGAACGGVWKSIDAGVNWTACDDLLPALSIADIAINPNYTDSIYVATGDGYGYENGSDFWGGVYTGGIFVSGDGGLTFTPTGLSFVQNNKQIVQRILINPNNTKIIIACTRNFIYQSVDAGNSWIRVQSGHFFDLEFKPGDPQVIYAAGQGKIFKSIDGGATFTAGATTLGTGRISVAVTDANPSVVYVMAESGEFWKSTDDGVTYNGRTSPTGFTTFYGYYDNVLGVSQQDEDHVLTGGIDVLVSGDGGFTWSTAANNNGASDYVHADQKNIEFDKNSDNIIYVVNDGGIFKTINGGFTWTDLGDNIHIKQYYSISTSVSNTNIYYGGAQDNGTDQNNNGTWRHVNGGDGMDCAVSPTNGSIAFVSYQYGAFRKTTNNGNSFISTGPGGQTGAWVTPIAFDPINSNNVYIGYQDLYKSNNTGTTWLSISSNVLGGSDIELLRISAANSNYIYAGTTNQLKKSTDGGITFTDITSGLPISAGAIIDVAISSVNPDQIWVSISGYVANQKVYSSTDGGITWTNVSGVNLPNVPATTIIYQPGSNDMLYLGTDLGMFYKDNSMPDWMPYNNGLPNVMISELEIVPGLNKLRAATYGRGFWEVDLAPSPFSALDAGSIAFQSFPKQTCNQNINPDVIIKNFGTSTLTSLTLNYQIDNGVTQTFPWSGSINTLTTTTITLPSIFLNDGLHTIKVFVSSPNGSADQNAINDTIVAEILVSSLSTAAPIFENFENNFPPVNFRIEDSNGILSQTSVAGGFGSSSKSMIASFFTEANGRAEMISDPIDMTILSSPAQLTFDLAYKRYNPAILDSVIVKASDDCGLTWSTLYAKSKTTLSTTSGYSTSNFVPIATDWRKEIVSLTQYAGVNHLLLDFVFVTGYGNNVYIDNINIDNLTGIKENLGGQMSIYPNPTSDEIRIRLSENKLSKLTIQLLDVTGKLVISKEFSALGSDDELLIPVNQIAVGYYNLSIRSAENATINYPVIITR